jgi:membrane-associated phospholipid phosphatase
MLAFVVVIAATSRAPIASATPEESMPTPLDALAPNVADAFSGPNLGYFALAIVATGVLAFSGADHAAHSAFAHHLDNEMWSTTANVAGYVIPIAVAPTIWVVGLARKNRKLVGAGSAAVQAVLVTAATTAVLKFVSGRPYPAHDGDVGDPSRAREFSPFQHGLGAWPSGHTGTTISIAAALTAYLPEERWVPLVGYPLALGIGFGMIDRDSHWVSDVVAGALIGHAIGYTIGRNFRRREDARRIEVVPLAGSVTGVALSGRW